MTDKFEYNYSSPTPEERREIEEIKRKYISKEKNESKITELRKLDKKVRIIPKGVGISIGVSGVLIFGTGLTCILEWNQIVWGIILGVIGVLFVLVAGSIYKYLYNKLKEKYKPKVLALSEELLNHIEN
ncbi:MAG: hypothetical protein K2I42_03955 [Anaeroplasmataceae bacterium]|nr:hypothetical protein [Anaeroplasmataceae bacterium]